MYLNEATLLNNVRLRYNKDTIYVSATCVADVTVASGASEVGVGRCRSIDEPASLLVASRRVRAA